MLNERETRDLFEGLGPEAGALTREQWLRAAFGRERKFRHYASEFIYRPESSDKPGSLIFGWIGRERRVPERTPPDQGFEPTEHLGWQAAFIAIDPSSHADGQKVAMESSREIGVPKAVFRSLVNSINQDIASRYFMQSFPIVVAGSFWEFAAAHRNAIKSITFDVAVPNMFGGASDFENEMKVVQKELNGSRIKTLIESDTKLNYGDDRLADIVNYVERGAGELYAEAVDGEKYSSTSHEKRVNLEIENPTKNISAFWRDFWQVVDKIFP